MGTPQDHRKCAEECVAMAQAAEDPKDKALWLTLAQSWVRLAEHVARARDRSATPPTATTFSPSTLPIEPGAGRRELSSPPRSLTAGDCRALRGRRR